MIGTHPVAFLAPLDYRCALDAAMPLLAEVRAPAVVCNVPQLLPEVRQRIPCWASGSTAEAALWVEPLVDTWRADLANLANGLTVGGTLVVVASRPIARVLPERRAWSGRPLGLHLSGIRCLRQALAQAGFLVEESHGFHSSVAIALGVLSRFVECVGRPDLGDRLHFASRLHYRVAGPLAPLSTVVLLPARKAD